MMEKIYAYSNKAGRHTVNSGKYLYLFLRTVVVAAISLAAVIILNLFRCHLNIDAPVKNTVGTKMIWAIMGIGSLKSVEYLI